MSTAKLNEPALIFGMDRNPAWRIAHEMIRPDVTGWYHGDPQRSMQYIRKFAPCSKRIVDVGAGGSTLIDALLEDKYERPIAVDKSNVGLESAKDRLGLRATLVTWIVADVTALPVLPAVDVWHDRSTLHFLTHVTEQSAYAAVAARTVRPTGYLVLSTFAPEFWQACSDRSICRHDAASLSRLLGASFELVREDRENRYAPSGAAQRFVWTVFRRRFGVTRRFRDSTIPATPAA